MSVLLRADMWLRPHWFPTHRASWATRGNDSGSLDTEFPRLRTRHATRERGVRLFLTVQVVRHDDDSVLVVVVTEFHASHAKLFPCFAVKFRDTGCPTEWGFRVWQPLEHLLERQPQCLELLFFHPDSERLAIYDRQEPEPAVTWFAKCFDLHSLRVEISTHAYQPPADGKKVSLVPVT